LKAEVAQIKSSLLHQTPPYLLHLVYPLTFLSSFSTVVLDPLTLLNKTLMRQYDFSPHPGTHKEFVLWNIFSPFFHIRLSFSQESALPMLKFFWISNTLNYTFQRSCHCLKR
jgi:hypothetical protein